MEDPDYDPTLTAWFKSLEQLGDIPMALVATRRDKFEGDAL
eukprot:CAMPEP_0116873388 /NCGR_PEP_ID=MMETSP0463-20121206/4476_1 /TAXON_ID=181622 /ORGANISM="Strombidinopsis sp, Strain SopsisLIS2011" /LENGTH=40 /DNA_ID= /DNA_START= /DNA_END= /DNA_ORIENTATION=